MLRRVRELQGYTIGATDGDIGRVTDLYFDDDSWTIRSFVVDTGTWLPGRMVLISPASILGIDPPGLRLQTDLTRRRVEESPSVDTSRPVSRQHEVAAARHYGHPYYWMGPYRWGPLAYPGAAVPPPGASAHQGLTTEEITAREREWADPSLRSVNAVHGYTIEATDGRLGHVEDFLIDEQSWTIRYLVIDPRSWWPGPHVIVSTEWLEDVRWSDSAVVVNVTREAVRNAPRYETRGPLPREFETRLHGHYRRPGYWERPPEAWILRPPAA